MSIGAYAYIFNLGGRQIVAYGVRINIWVDNLVPNIY
jgi:hypothetical protein